MIFVLIIASSTNSNTLNVSEFQNFYIDEYIQPGQALHNVNFYEHFLRQFLRLFFSNRYANHTLDLDQKLTKENYGILHQHHIPKNYTL